jgi:hypothetical protein
MYFVLARDTLQQAKKQNPTYKNKWGFFSNAWYYRTFVVSAGIEPATQGFSVFFAGCQKRHKNRSDCF